MAAATGASSSSKIRVHDADLFTEVVTAGEVYVSTEETAPTRSRTRQEMHEDAMRTKRRLKDEEFQREFERAKRERDRRVSETMRRKDMSGDALLQSLHYEQETFVREIESTLQLDERAKSLKREQLYQEWSERVFDPIQRQIQSTLEQVSVATIERRRRQAFEKFLHQTNTKAGLFRDIIIPSEYNPLEEHKHRVRYDISKIDDPVKRSLTRVDKERASVGAAAPDGSAAAAEHAAGRETFDVRLWDKVESTPHGHYSAMDEKPSAGRREQPKGARSTLVMDDFNVDRSGQALKSELPRGKRVYPDRM